MSAGVSNLSKNPSRLHKDFKGIRVYRNWRDKNSRIHRDLVWVDRAERYLGRLIDAIDAIDRALFVLGDLVLGIRVGDSR